VTILRRRLSKLIVMAAESDAVGPFNAGSGKGVSLNELIEVIASATKAKVSEFTARSID